MQKLKFVSIRQSYSYASSVNEFIVQYNKRCRQRKFLKANFCAAEPVALHARRTYEAIMDV